MIQKGVVQMYAYAGISSAQKIGKYSVDESARLMKRIAYIYRRLMMIGAAQMPARVNWHFKAGLARHLFEDSQAAGLFMKRASELRSPQAQQLKDPDPWLALFFDELLMARSDYELWTGIYGVVRPALRQLLKQYIVETQQLVDYPSLRVMKQILLDLDEQTTWGEAIQPVLVEDAAFFTAHQGTYSITVDDEISAASFRDYLLDLLTQIGGIEGNALHKVENVPNRMRSQDKYSVPLIAVRDPRMGGETLGRTGVANPPTEPEMAKLVANIRTRQEELGASELCAVTMVLQQNMPWSFYEDLARHCWDEMRHTLFGQAVLDLGGYDWYSMPQFKGDYDPHMKKPVANSYVWLSIGIEGSAMKKDGMPKEARMLKAMAEKTNNEIVKLFAQCVDFDWADEVTHHQFGRKWAEDLIGDYHTSERIANREMQLNLARMARDTYSYWQDKPDSFDKQMHLSEWKSHLRPELLKELEEEPLHP
jgi:hypothetical protein